MADKQLPVSVEFIESKIFIIRGQKVMLSMHLAELYEVEPRVMVQAVKRNIERFPEDFMFQLNSGEFANLKSQFVISSWAGLAGPHLMPSSRACQFEVPIWHLKFKVTNCDLKQNRLWDFERERQNAKTSS